MQQGFITRLSGARTSPRSQHPSPAQPRSQLQLPSAPHDPWPQHVFPEALTGHARTGTLQHAPRQPSAHAHL